MPTARFGKTRKDREKGALSRNRANKEARNTWLKENRGSQGGREISPFPTYTCGGKGNSSNPTVIRNNHRKTAR